MKLVLYIYFEQHLDIPHSRICATFFWSLK